MQRETARLDIQVMRAKKRLIFVLISLLIVAVIGCWHLRSKIDPLAKYGVSYKIETGQDGIIQFVHFTWKRSGGIINGPYVMDEDLVVEYKPVGGSQIPLIVVRSDGVNHHYAILKLNFDDQNKPEFELLENHGTWIRYFYPWQNYYRLDEKSGATEPVPKNRE